LAAAALLALLLLPACGGGGGDWENVTGVPGDDNSVIPPAPPDAADPGVADIRDQLLAGAADHAAGVFLEHLRGEYRRRAVRGQLRRPLLDARPGRPV